MNRIFSSFRIALVFVLSLSFTQNSLAEITDAQKAEAMKNLASLLSQKNAIRQTPVSKRHGANSFEVKVQLIELKDRDNGNLNKVLESEMKDIMRAYSSSEDGSAPSLLSFVGSDARVTLLSGGTSETTVQKYLHSILSPKISSAFKKIAINAELGISSAWFQIYDIGSELIGDEVIVLHDFWAQKAIVIRISYSQS